MQNVITSKQAKEILGGRTPHLPVEYETAVKALAECVTIDEAKYWDNKADALAAWAKIYHSPEAERSARRLKLHAYRRMGQLAGELRPSKSLGSKSLGGGRKQMLGHAPGPRSILVEAGLTMPAATTARTVAKLSAEDFQHFIDMPRPPSPSMVFNTKRGGTAAWHSLYRNASCPAAWRSFCRMNDPVKLAADLAPDEALKARELIAEVVDWLDEFERRLTSRCSEGGPQ